MSSFKSLILFSYFASAFKRFSNPLTPIIKVCPSNVLLSELEDKLMKYSWVDVSNLGLE